MHSKELLYYNQYGGFSSDGKEYIIETNEETTPLPWSHIIANKDFGTIITANGGGYIWHKNSQSNKITCWSNDSLQDTASEKIVLCIDDFEINVLPYKTLEKYKVIYGFGYAKFLYNCEDVSLETTIYVPVDKSKKVYDIKINIKREYEKAYLKYYMSPVLGVTREFTKKHIVIEKEENAIVLKNRYRENYSDNDIYIKASENITGYSFEDSKVNFRIMLNNPIKIIQLEVQAEESDFQDISTDMKKIKDFWEGKMSNVKVYTPVESMNIMMNGWLLYQTLACRLWARTSFYQAGGAFGFRDQLQDSLCFLWFDSNITKNQILYHAAHQFEEGDVLHWWHPEKNNGTRTRYTDDLLWLPYVLSKYIEFTGDKSILDEKVPYVKADVLKENEVERYTDTTTTAYEDTLYNHAKQAIKRGVKISKNGLPKMDGGDWNDGMNKIKGQSIWLRIFYIRCIKSF